MTIIGRIRSMALEKRLRRLDQEYSMPSSRESREAEQLALLNREWRRVTETSPYFGELARQKNIPEQFSSLEEFAEKVPVTDRDVVQEHILTIPCRGRSADRILMTGGTTNKPVQIPSWNSEKKIIQQDNWLGRRWYGISPHSRLFMIWGHSHLLGSGFRGWVNGRIRILYDRLLGYSRFSAYDMQETAMRKAGDAVLKARPEYIMGFATALHHFAVANAERKEAFRSLGLRVVIGTCERFPSPDTAERLEELFGCTVTMEYGAAEVGLIAHIHPEGGYRAFWKSLMLEAEPTAGGRHRILITSMHPRCFPLVRYEIGDEIQVHEDGSGSVIRGLDRFHRVVGRSFDFVPLEDGAMIHYDVFASAVKIWRELQSFQVVYGAGPLRIDYLAGSEIPEKMKAAMRERFVKAHPGLREIQFRRVQTLKQTLAGKKKVVVRESAS